MMKLNKFHVTTLGLITSASLVACGPNTKGEEGAEVSHTTAKQAITENTTNVADRLGKSLVFLENSEIFHEGFTRATVSPEADCFEETAPDGSTELRCGTDTTAEQETRFEANFNDDAAALTELLETRIFVESNIESETDTSVTYLLKGEVLCEQEGEPLDTDCAKNIDDAEIRLHVTSPQEGDVDLAVLVGPQQHNPLYFEFYSSSLAVELDLGGVKGSLEHLSTVSGEDLTADLPETIKGRIRVALQQDGDNQFTAALSVLQGVHVADADWSIEVAQAIPALQIKADGDAQTLETMVALAAIDADFPFTQTSWDENGNETSETHQYTFHLGGLSATTLLDAAAELVDVTNIGLGDSTTTLDIDGNRVLGVDLNADDGRRFDAKIKYTEAGLEYEVSPSFDLKVALQFMNAAGALDDVADWMLDDVLHVRLDGAANPKVRFNEGGELEVLEGQLSLSLANAGITHTVDAGMCLVTVEQTPDETTGFDESTSSNPLEEVEAGACQ